MNISLLSLLERCKNFLDFFSYQNYTSVRIQMGNSVHRFKTTGWLLKGSRGVPNYKPKQLP